MIPFFKNQCFLWVFLISIAAFSQKQSFYAYESEQGTKFFADSAEYYAEIDELVNELRSAGYLLSGVDSFYTVEDTLYATVYNGPKLNFVHARLKRSSGHDFRNISDEYKEYSLDQYFKKRQRIIEEMENTGYPFAALKTDSLYWDQNSFYIDLGLSPGPKIVFDTIMIKGDVNIRNDFIAAYLNIRRLGAYDQRSIDNAEFLIRQLPYLSMERKPVVRFKDDFAYPVFFLSTRKANQFDGILGFLPNEEESGSLLITGELNLDLQNPLGAGRRIKLNWNRIDSESQNLDFHFKQRNLLGLPIGASFDFGLLRQDTTFRNLNYKISLGYQLGTAGYISFYYSLKRSRLLSLSQFESPGITFSNLPVAEFDLNSYGLSYEYSSLDDPFVPRRGFLFRGDFSLGNKTIIENANLEIENPDFYDEVDLKTGQYALEYELEKYFSIFRNSVIRLRSTGGWIENENLVINDLTRLGGLNSIRGFNENFFYAQRFQVLTAEFRQVVGANSYLSFLSDGSYIFYNVGDEEYEDFPFGTGVGMTFETKSGIFRFIYSMGKSRDQSFGFNFSKIHFGLISRF